MNSSEEKVVAVIGPAVSDGENELTVQVTGIENEAGLIRVTTEKEYQEAGEFGVMLKEKMAEVTDFFAPMKKAAHEAHKQVCDREKQMLSPLKNAEKSLKKAMGDYALKIEQERRRAEEEARRLAQEEAARKLEESIEAEANGDIEAAREAMLDAELAETASTEIRVDSSAPKTKGVSTTKDWEIESIDLSKVPNEIAGVLIRPVDEAAVIKLIRASKGTIKIEGINYKETIKMSFRRS